MKKIYICPETKATALFVVQFFCASPGFPGTTVDGPEGPTGSVGNDDETPTEDDALGKQANIWDDWGEDTAE